MSEKTQTVQGPSVYSPPRWIVIDDSGAYMFETLAPVPLLAIGHAVKAKGEFLEGWTALKRCGYRCIEVELKPL